jgi:hypothetical protein
MASIIGGCLCGAVRYQGEAEPAFVGICHCHNCQRATGSAFAPVVGIPLAALQVEGEVKTFRDQGDSGKALLRRFCPECGSSLFYEAEGMPGLVMVLTGTLDDASWVKPAVQIFCDSAQPWVELGGEMQRFPRMIGAPPG